ncbi:ABC transporter permease [Timonella sp. A28]|uniref:ABC transporter permease n=1 Tax=Timonella sp. A28 TaxID=3442640 RepID=UPI003EB87F48
MSAATLEHVTATPVQTGKPGIPFGRLFQVEFRKLFDTRAARILLGLLAVGVLAIVTVMVFVGRGDDKSYAGFVEGAFMPVTMLLPVIAILATTSEWSQRTALTTFMWEPRRVRVLSAKFVAAFIVAIFAALTVLAFAAMGAGAATLTGSELDWTSNGKVLAGYAILIFVLVGQGIAFGSLIHNTAGALVLYFMLPTVMTLLTSLIEPLREIKEWIDINVASTPIIEGTFSGEALAHYATAVTLWVIIPGAIGVWRTLNREAK